jgi:hypothetical protein
MNRAQLLYPIPQPQHPLSLIYDKSESIRPDSITEGGSAGAKAAGYETGVSRT